jgi:hypothetical protein
MGNEWLLMLFFSLTNLSPVFVNVEKVLMVDHSLIPMDTLYSEMLVSEISQTPAMIGIYTTPVRC